MSIFGIDWNGDGNIDFADTAIDAMLIDEMEAEEKESDPFDDDDEDNF